MSRLSFRLAILLGCATAFGPDAGASTNVTSRIDRTIGREPKYQSTPKYSVLALGDRGEVKVWMVEDGRRLFVDKNANGDLTDDGPPLEPRNVRHLDAKRWDFDYVLDAITPEDGSRHTNLVLRRWNYEGGEDCYGLSLSVGSRLPMYAGWFGTFWSTNRAEAPVIHFGGPFRPHMLRRKVFTIGEQGQRLSIGFFSAGSGPGAESRLSIEAVPRFLTPVLTIEWPAADGGAPLRTTHELTERCCYWEYYTTTFEVPKGAVPGKAKISVNLPRFTTPIELTTTNIELQVVAPSQVSTSEQ